MSGTDDLTITRRRANRPDRQVHRDDDREPPVIIEGDSGGTPEDALADSARQLKASAARATAAEQRARDAEAARIAAEQQVANATAGRQSDRAIVVQSVIDGATAELEGARAGYKQAREAGDVDGELAAQEAIAAATYKLTQANQEAAVIAEQNKRAPARGTPVQPAGTPPAVQAWFDSHPRFNTDMTYQRIAKGLHPEAIAAGHDGRSQAYVDWIDAKLTEMFGEGHGQAEPDSGSHRDMSDTGGRDRTGDSLPPSRGTGGGGGRMKQARVPLGHNGGYTIVQYEGTPEKPTRIKFANADVAANFREGAKLDTRAWDRDPDGTLVDYVSQWLQEAAEGNTTIKHGEGQTLGREE